MSWPPLQTITHKYVVIPVFNSLLWTKMHSFPFSVQSCLRSWPFCPYPVSWCIFSKPSKLCAVAHTEVFLCCWYMWVKEESFENRKIGILPSTKWKGFTKLEVFSLMSDQSKLIFSRNSLSENVATPAPSLLYLYTQRSIWKAALEWDSINLCHNKGQRLGVNSTQLRSRGMIDVSLHSTSGWKEALSKQIACSQNIPCVLNCPKILRFFGNMKWCLHPFIKYHCCLLDQCWDVYALWLVDELNKSVISLCCKSLSWRTSSISGWPLSEEEKASGQW